MFSLFACAVAIVGIELMDSFFSLFIPFSVLLHMCGLFGQGRCEVPRAVALRSRFVMAKLQARIPELIILHTSFPVGIIFLINFFIFLLLESDKRLITILSWLKLYVLGSQRLVYLFDVARLSVDVWIVLVWVYILVLIGILVIFVHS